ncbi:MAG: hypothetical protein N3E46_10085 [Gemmataceae bacterium]|nr:hypothetical protein [Gemmataceae bacterium]
MNSWIAGDGAGRVGAGGSSLPDEGGTAGGGGGVTGAAGTGGVGTAGRREDFAGGGTEGFVGEAADAGEGWADAGVVPLVEAGGASFGERRPGIFAGVVGDAGTAEAGASAGEWEVREGAAVRGMTIWGGREEAGAASERGAGAGGGGSGSTGAPRGCALKI